MLFQSKTFQRFQYIKTIDVYKRQRQLSWMSAVGYLCIVVALGGMAILSSPWVIAQSIASLQRLQQHTLVVAGDDRMQSPQPTTVPTSTPDPASLPFAIEIPQIGVSSTVVANVDASNESEYTAALKQGVAHAYGSAFPGQGKMVYIFGHSTDYAWNVAAWNALFYQVKDLAAGADIYLLHGEQRFRYQVKETHIVQPADISLLQSYNDQEVLILQTCYPPGTTWQRLLVVAEPVK